MSTTGGIKVFSGNANRVLTQEICNYLSCDPGLATTDRFSDGEFNFQITENVRGADVFIVQPTCPPTDSHLMELLVMLDAFRRSSAERVTAVIPYFGCALGQEGQAARADCGEACGEFNQHRRGRPCADDGLARGADSRVL